ncbi:MAG: ThiF family adenylyltransferase [Phycisphaerales bacterium]|nr:ThiF family adenylyltransferase [Phycisphaerales bacterium]
MDEKLSRYSRQVLFERFGEAAQRRLMASRALLVGCGALGTVMADSLVRAGIGFLRLCDRDYIERDNLQRQVLFDEDDLASGLPKAEAAARKLRRINPDVEVEPHIVDVHPGNIECLAEGADVLLDGTDNFETRFLINDLAVKTGRPWVYAAVIGASGLVMPVLPGETPCLRCVFESAPPPEMNPTCDTAGVLGPAVKVVAALATMEAMKLLSGLKDEVTRGLMTVDVWSGRVTTMNASGAMQQGECPCCKGREFEYLGGKLASTHVTLCGRDAVQIQPPQGTRVDFAALAEKIERASGRPARRSAFMLQAEVDGLTLTVFGDGRAILKGTKDAPRAKSIYAKYIGN